MAVVIVVVVVVVSVIAVVVAVTGDGRNLSGFGSRWFAAGMGAILGGG